jgi:response regulator RpfG family c-di-GMP phosphodiesterase
MADAYDTMASGRVYRDAMSHRQIMELLSLERGHQHDPSLFSAFSSVIERSVYRAVQI